MSETYFEIRKQMLRMGECVSGKEINADAKPRILVISSRAPSPPLSGGQIRAMNNIKMLSKIYEVDLLYLSRNRPSDSSINSLKPFIANVYFFRHRIMDFVSGCFRSMFLDKRPFQVNIYILRRVFTWLKVNQDKYKGVFCMLLRTAEYAIACDKVAYKCIDYVDALSLNYEREVGRSRGLMKIVYSIEKKRVKKYEQIIGGAFNLKLITSIKDKEYLEKSGIEDITVLPHIVFTKELNTNIQEVPLFGDYVVFVGKMNYAPNVEAAITFAKQVFPELRRKLPQINLLIVGQSPSPSIRALSRDIGIFITGMVEDVIPYVKGSLAMVAPMVSGAGVQTKILEAMSLGCCVVTTPLGAAGLDNLKGDELLVVKKIGDMAEVLARFLAPDNSSSREGMGFRAREYYYSRYSYDAVQEQFLRAIQDSNVDSNK